MKKLFYLFLLLPFSLLSCSDDKDLSPVDMTLTLGGVTQNNDVFYTVAGETVTIENLSVKSVDNKNTAVTNVMFYLNGVPLFANPQDNFNISFTTENIPAGTYPLEITGNLLQVDASIKVFAVPYTLTIVDDAEALPSGSPEIGSYSQTIRLTE